MHRVLVTGAAGAIGEPVCRELSRLGHHVRGFDRKPSSAVDDFHTGDLVDGDAVARAVAGMDTVVHLGAVPDEAPFAQLVGPNVLGLYHVLDAARRYAVRRVVLASSIQVVYGAPPEAFMKTTDRCPANHYALTKLFAEDMGEMYSRCHGLSVIAARICWMVRNRREAEHMMQLGAYTNYLSRGDATRFFARAVEAKEVTFAVLYVSGPEGASRVDLESARRLIGYEPQDAWPRGLPADAAEVAAGRYAQG